jgi:lipopolysaccharide/colanic/teichoic acid biosynthesis glycosyltransferase
MTTEEVVIETDSRIATEKFFSAEAEVEYQRTQGRSGYRVAKRVFDIVFSTFVLVILFIPALILCIIIRADSQGNPIYVQHRVARVGKDGKIKTFPMLKFRSMHKDADSRLDELQEFNEADGPLFKIKDDPRITGIGRFIRKHSIDEMPQFVNCWLGQMSVCGPRPPFLREVKYYSEHDMRRLSVKPGLTGYWQIHGRSDTGFNDMVQLDLKYIEDKSMLTDIKIILKTVAVVFTGKGAW